MSGTWVERKAGTEDSKRSSVTGEEVVTAQLLEPERAVEPECTSLCVRRRQEHGRMGNPTRETDQQIPAGAHALVLRQDVELGQFERIGKPQWCQFLAESALHEVMPPLPGGRGVAVAEPDERAVVE